MQARITRIDKNLLHRTAGPYIGVNLRHYRIVTLATAPPQSADITPAVAEIGPADREGALAQQAVPV